ncbi:hypothetical protein KSS87_023181, partial [Heliosperma pusillum]
MIVLQITWLILWVSLINKLSPFPQSALNARRYGVDSCILQAFRILRQVMGCHSYVITVFSKPGARYIFTSVKNLLPNVALLRSYGIPIELIRKHLLTKPGSYIHNPRVFKDVT